MEEDRPTTRVLAFLPFFDFPNKNPFYPFPSLDEGKMLRLTKNRAAQTFAFLAFLAFFVHSLHFCHLHCEAEGDRERNAEKTSDRADVFHFAHSLTAGAFDRSEAPSASTPAPDERIDRCYLAYSPLQKTGANPSFPGSSDFPTFASSVDSPVKDSQNGAIYRFQRLDAPPSVPLYLRGNALLI